MDYQDKHTETIVECARSIRRIQETKIDTLLCVIQNELINKFPSIKDRKENGPVDWSHDIINSENDEEVVKTINRIDNIVNQSWKCRYCKKDTYDVDSDYLFGFDHIQCALNDEYSKDKKVTQCKSDDIESLKHEFDQIARILHRLQDRISKLETTKIA